MASKARLGWLAFLVAVVVVPAVSGGYVGHVAVFISIYVILASSLNIMIGLSGRTCFAHAAFAVIGGYACALLQMRLHIPYWIALAMAGVVTAIAGVMLGIPATRTRGPYLSLVTLGFGEIVRQVSINAMNLTRGPLGIPGLPRPSIAGRRFGQYEMFLLCFLTAVATVVICSRLMHSRFGRSVMAIREDETAAQAFGIDIARTTVIAFAVSAFFAGIAGALSATYLQLISPDLFTFADMFIMVCMVVLGGSGTVFGPVLGAAMLAAAPEMLRFLDEYRMLVFGALLVAGIRWWPSGVISKRLDEKLLRGFYFGAGARD